MEAIQSKYIDDMKKQKKQLLDKLEYYKPYISYEVYAYYKNMLDLIGNIWNRESDKNYKMFSKLFEDIITFNLRYYMASYLDGRLGPKEYDFYESRYKPSSTIIHDKYGYEAAELIVDASVEEQQNPGPKNWCLTLHRGAFNEPYMNARFEAIERLLKEVEKRNGLSNEKVVLDNKLARISNRPKWHIERSVERSESTKPIIDLLAKTYGVELPKLNIPEEYSQDFSNVEDKQLIKLVHNNFVTGSAITAEDETLKTNSHGKIKIYSYYCDNA